MQRQADRVRIGAHGLHAKTCALALEQVDGALVPIEPVAPSSVTVRSVGAGAGRSKARGDVSDFIDLPHQQTAARRLEPAAQQSDQRGHHAGRDEAVEAIHQPAVARN